MFNIENLNSVNFNSSCIKIEIKYKTRSFIDAKTLGKVLSTMNDSH